MYYIGIDLGGTNIAAGIVDENGIISTRMSIPTNVSRPAEEICRDMGRMCVDLIEKAGLTKADIKAIGCGVPGIPDPVTNHIIFCTNLGWYDIPLETYIREVIDIPVFIGNDATVAGLAESVAGVSQNVQTSIFITLGTGVGGGIVFDGKPYSGPHGIASEIGHQIVVVNGEQCTCGNKGCWERYASATALINAGIKAMEEHPDCAIAQKASGNKEHVSAKTVIDAAKEGDAVAKEVFDNYITYLAAGMVSLINLFDPDVFALGGGVSHAGEFLLTAVREKVASMIFYKDVSYARIELAKLGNDAGIVGAAMLGR